MRTLFNILVNVGLIAIAVGVALPFFQGPGSTLFHYVYAAGAALLVIGRLFTPYQGSNTRAKRLHRIQTWSAIFFCCAAFLMFYAPHTRDWLAFTLAGAVIQAYVSIAIPLAEKRGNTPKA
jgi:uncharacterized membrane protein HdeD (DUF308 family)